MPVMPADPLPDRRRPVHLAVTASGGRATIFFVTVCTKDRRPILATPEVMAVCARAWEEAGRFRVGRYVLMPDHVHFFCAPAVSPPESLAGWVGFWKSVVARGWPGGAAAGKVWQRDHWDTQLRAGDSYAAKWDYVRQNPVRAGLVDSADEWPFQGELHPLWWHG